MATRDSRHFAKNPPWVDGVLNQYWGKLSRKVGRKLMPVCMKTGKRSRACQELGCGFWGCVLPTWTEGMVLKITMDLAEAQFVAAALSLGDIQPGVVRYHHIFELPDPNYGRVGTSGRMFAIWREEAFNPGGLVEEQTRYEKLFGLSDYVAGLKALRDHFNVSRVLRRYLDDMNMRQMMDALFEVENKAPQEELPEGPAYMVDSYLTDLRNTAFAMADTKILQQVGSAIVRYLDQGFFSADVHADNIGEVKDNSKLGFHLAITDPGLMVPLKRKWLSVKVPVLA